MPQRSRTTISLSAGLAALVLGLSACSGSTPGADTGTTADGEDTLRLAFLGGISTPDPDSAYDGYELNLVNSAYEGLLDYRPGQAEPELVGRLASEWTASDDNTEFTFTLREGVTFHDGTPFTADAVKASFDRRLAVDAGPAYMVKGVESVTSSGENEVTVRLSSPNASFLDLLASPFGPKMISPAALKEHPWTGEEDNWFATNDAGTGPYSYSAFEPGVSYGLKEYADYWGEEPGYANVDFAVASNLSTVQLQLEKGEVDGLIGYTDSASYASLESKENLTGYTFPSMQTPTLFVNPKSPELSDDATRKAFMAGIDFPSLAQKALGDTGAPTTQVFPENLIPAELNQQKIQPVPGALPDLAEGKLSSGTISCGYPESSASGQALCDNLTAGLNEAGVKAESTGYASGTFFPALEKGADGPDITFFSGFPDTAHPDAWGTVFYTPDGGLDLFGAEVPGVAQLLAEAAETDDEKLYGEVAAKVSESAYWYSAAKSLGTAVFQSGIGGVEKSYNPVITGYLQLQLLTPAGS
ncbi:ABC transporter substrate-binding protein [Kineosporia sp. NBRC 101677]|uniref:ABC transporter substrate-binding protein n=1 Tax=Kineosporia sp. NBRC 101677 TaxID=3032197 RepID=UPI0024A0E537|nr:ABC transporter substrate-binding protein [Kineosporia sp. NBRC 101677]GLY15499.1 ABC transporter substrate-binding protein [Kineosporia sp. NBRC 101677]